MPYSNDLRQRVITCYQNGEGSYSKLSKRFQVHFQTVRNWVVAAQTENRLTPKPHQSGNCSPLQAEHRDFLLSLYAEQCDLTHREVCQKLKEEYGMKISISSFSYALKRLKIPRKKKPVLIPKNMKSPLD